MNRLPWVILVFAIGFAAVHLVPLLVWKSWPANSLIGIGTALDLLSPLIMLPMYMLLYQWGHNRTPVQSSQPSMWWGLAFLVFAVLWVEGHGMHLAANAISLALKAANISGKPYAVTYLFDEVISHYLWHLGMVGLSALVVVREWLKPVLGQSAPWILILPAGLVYGGIFFGAVTEGGTWPLGLTFAVVFCVGGLVLGRARLRTQPLLAFFSTGYLVAAVCFVAWAVIWGGMPQFTEVGLIK